jgi:hypothetical protein
MTIHKSEQLQNESACFENQVSPNSRLPVSVKRILDTSSSINATDPCDDNKRRRKSNYDIPTIGDIESKEKPQGKKERKSKDKPNAHLKLSWICAECREAECATEPDSPLLVCEGLCSRPFHYPCAGLAALPPPQDEWICSDCQQCRHQCAVCHEYGADDVDVHKCNRKDCGLFFHEACLNLYDVDVRVTISDGQDGATKVKDEVSLMEGVNPPDGSVAVTAIEFICPAHHCWSCSGGVPVGIEKQNVERVEGMESCLKKNKKKKSCDAVSLSFKEKNDLLFVSLVFLCLLTS